MFIVKFQFAHLLVKSEGQGALISPVAPKDGGLMSQQLSLKCSESGMCEQGGGDVTDSEGAPGPTNTNYTL